MATCPGLYIPYVLDGYTFPVLKDLFSNKYRIGLIKHIDFVYSKTKLTHAGKPVRSAFVHFEYWMNSDFANFLWNQLEANGKYNLSNYIGYLESVRHEKTTQCMSCVNSIEFQIVNMKSQIDDIPILIQRPKQTQTESPEPVLENKMSDERTLDEIRILLEKHERRIELLEDQLRLLVNVDH